MTSRFPPVSDKTPLLFDFTKKELNNPFLPQRLRYSLIPYQIHIGVSDYYNCTYTVHTSFSSFIFHAISF
jgi:hypothetical protein